MLVDSFGRVVDYLRVSITNRCNFKCPYCKPGGNVHDPDELSADELLSMIKLSISHGVKKIRITGGEPALREDLTYMINQIHTYNPEVEITLTTNGYNLESIAAQLKEAGLKRVNISLDTLQKERFAHMTKTNMFENVMRGIDVAIEQGLKVKINMVPLKGLNEDEITPVFDYCKERGLMIRYIEYMENINADQHISGMRADEILEYISQKYAYGPYEKEHFGAAKLYETKDGYLFGIIEPHNEEFCKKCNRVRLTGNGKLVPCLFYEDAIDVGKELKSGDLQAVEAKLFQAVQEKPESNLWCEEGTENISTRAFNETGG